MRSLSAQMWQAVLMAAMFAIVGILASRPSSKYAPLPADHPLKLAGDRLDHIRQARSEFLACMKEALDEIAARQIELFGRR